MYRRIAPREGELRRHALAAAVFRRQIEELAVEGFRSISTLELDFALSHALPLAGRPIMLTFDGGYADFADHAGPVLREFGFSAVVFPVSAKAGGLADWIGGDQGPLMEWSQLQQLADEGIEIGSQSRTHRTLTRLSLPEVAVEARGSAIEIADHLGSPPAAFCFPFGARDILVDRLVAEAGYRLAFANRPGFCRLTEDPLSLPRIEIAGWESLDSFRRKLRI